MNQHLQNILSFLDQNNNLSVEEKNSIIKSLKDADKEFTITEFKLDRTEKVKKTTAVLLEETIEELERKRKDVEVQNKELEIQNALERVRAVALGMKEPADMLEICKTISQQLQLLNVKEIRNVQTAIFYEGKGTYMNYEYYAKHDKTIITETSFTNHKMHREFAAQMMKGKDEFFTTHISKAELPDWITYQKTTNVFIDDYLNTATSLNYYWYSLGAVALGISTYEPLKDEDINLFKRFLKVFELSYTRYLDIEQAEAQAREAQIQLALERVRARTMAMQKSDELTEAALLLFEQLQSLGAVLWSCGFNIWEKGKTECTSFITRGGKMLEPVKLFLNENPVLQLFNESRQKEEEFWFLELTGEDAKSVFGYVAKQRRLQTGDNVFLSEVTMPSSQITHLVNFSYGNLMFITLEPHPEFHNIFKRFGKVFEQTYTRFLDLQKAEAQAREAKIEAALEKVRSRSLAVHKSDEFNEVIKVVFERLQELEIPVTSASINVVIKDSKDTESYICGAGENGLTLSHIRLIHFDHPISNDRYNAYENGLEFFTNTYSKEEKDSFYEYEFEVSDLKYIPDDIKKMVMESECYTISTALTKNSMIVVNDFEGKLLSSQQIDIVKRFSKVFEQAYIRFLDLQKAEAQTREAEIELGLERVRSRAMAMQTSEELNALIGTVFTELTKLDLVLTRCVILIYEGNEKGVRWWMANSETPSTPMNFFVKYADMPFFNEYLKGWYNRELKWQYCLDDENKIKTDDFLFNETELSLLPDFVIEGMKAPDRVYLNASFNNFGNLTLATLEPLSEEHFNILLRFAKVFDLTYTRFNDLKQAEAQARESQIQLALERVRARTMAMYKSDDLAETARVLFTEFKKLNVLTDVGILDRAFISTVNEEKGVIEFWITALDGSEINRMFEGSIKEPIVFSKAYKAWKEQKKSLVIDVYGDDLIKYLNYLKSIDFPVNEELYELHRVNSVAFFSKGFIGITSLKLLPAESMQMMERFAQVFDITYTRFLDLQKAEAQTREAQIEAALEKVRSRSLAMHHSDELEQVVASLFDRLVELGLSFDGAGIFLFEKQKQNIQLWVASIHQAAPMSVNLPYDEEIENNEIYKVLWNAMEKGEHIHNRSYLGETKNDYFRYVWKHNEAKIPESIRKIHVESKTWTVSYAAEKNSIIGFDSWSGHLTSNEDFQILIRFARVFEQAYIRFLDLQKAEAQAREAQIETSLERVRSKTMAMHNSADVGETVATLFDELKKLGIETIRCGIGIMQNTKTMEVWTAKPNENNKIDLIIGHLDMNLHPLLQGAFKGWSNKEKSFSYELKQDDLINYFTAINNHPAYPVQYNIATLPSTIYHNDFFFSEGTLFAFSITQLSDENKKICKRFSAVFGQTYRRYLDLKKAEAQARAAQIEAALERVRAKAMAMQNSNDLSIAASMVFTELRKLGINPIRYGVGLLNKESRKAQLYSVTSSSDGDSLSLVGWVMLAGHTVLENIYDTWLKNEDYYPELTGEQLKSYYENLLAGLSLPTVPNWQTTEKQYGHFFSFSVGCLYAWSNRHYSDSEIKILKRFATIIDLTFRRFLELQTSEANTREAIKQAALDRIRADIASMRTVSDLNRITPLIWNELTILGIPFIRCGVFIMNDEQQLIYTFLSTPDGKAIAAFHIPYTTLGNIKHVLSHWHDKKNYIDHWDENAFTEFASTLVTQGALTSSTQYLKTIPHGGFYLHFLPFLQGMLYVGNTTQLGEEEINLIQSVADAFSTAYARYEDFNKLEAAKQQIEKTLTDLKQTQQQLVQSEKMASLGELTAGIAHEIQNPLNFVNNFSEVSKELIDEMRIALESGDKEEAEHIASDVIQNLEKINHHGKRADAIVKNMLQHSRKSSGQKEPTDINALCDEYLRLSFHGMRAKDKNFNADFKTDFDNSIGKINVVPQNIGRVLLNLFNNAFYAVNEKKKLLANSYHPIAEVKTRRINDKVEIIVSDNGNGIPQNIIDKIFQPFFTTKPTGEGTGLGLSLAYDIITKEHNGTIKVESKEGEGSEFIIRLS